MGRTKTIMVMILGILITTVASAQTPQMTQDQQNRINRTLDSRYSGLDKNSVRWEKNNDGNFVGSFRHNNRDMRATFDRQGNWINSSETIRMDDLPRDFRNNLSSTYGRNRISSVERVTTKDDETLYDVTVTGQNEPVRYNSNGTLYNDSGNNNNRNNLNNNRNNLNNNRNNNNNNRNNNNRDNNNRNNNNPRDL